MFRHGSVPASVAADFRSGFGLNARVDRAIGAPLNLGAAPAPLLAYRRDYVRIAAWLFAFLFGPALVTLIVLLVT